MTRWIDSRILLRIIGFWCALAVFGLQAAWAQPANGEGASLGFTDQADDKGIPQPWSFAVSRRGDNAHARVQQEGNEAVLHLRSVRSSLSLERSFKADVKERPFLNWSWKAVGLPADGDVRAKGKNDQALQVLVGFDGGKVLSYIWDTNAPEGTVVEESYPWPIDLSIRVLVVQSGGSDMGKWIRVSRNLYEDYKRLFQEEPPPTYGVRIQMNTQHTGGSAEGFIKEMVSRKTDG
jgi:hypothetical protein